METHAMDGAVISQLTSAAMVVYFLQFLKNTSWYPRFAQWVPIADANVHRIVSLVGAFVSAIGVHVAFEGSAAAGWHFTGTIPPLAVLLHSLWDLGQQFALNQLTYDAVAKRSNSGAMIDELLQAIKTTGVKMVLVVGLCTAAMLTASCAHMSPKVTIDVADRTAYNAARALQKGVEADYRAHQAWPSFAERQKINILLGGDPRCHPSAAGVCKKGIYDLVIDVANIGINLPPGNKLSAEDLRVAADLQQAVTDLVSLVSTRAAQSIQDKATDFKTKAGTLLAVVKGATQ